MGYAALAYDYETPSMDQMEGLIQSSLDAPQIQRINELKNQIHKSIWEAQELSEKDKELLFMEFQKTDDTNRGELARFALKVNTVKAQSRTLTTDIARELRSQRELDQAKELKKFLELSLEEKISYSEQLKIRRENIGKYLGFLEKNKKHFSKKSRKEYLDQFKELSLKEQDEWIQKFEEELKIRQELTEKYESFSAEHQKLAVNFFELARHEKEFMIRRLEGILSCEYRAILYGKFSKHVSETGKKNALAYFHHQSTKIAARELALKMLEGQMKHEAELTFKFEKFPPEIQQKYFHFYDLDYEKKVDLLKKIKEEVGEKEYEKAERALNIYRYKELLKEARKNQHIATKTEKSFLTWFKNLETIKEQSDAMEAFEKEMEPRRKLLGKFREKVAKLKEKEVPTKVKKQVSNRFVELSYHERLEFFENLENNIQKIMGFTPANENDIDDKKDQSAETKAPEKLVSKKKTPEQKEQNISAAIQKARQSIIFRKQQTAFTLANFFAQLAKNSEYANGGVSDSTRKIKDLNSDERKIQEALQKQTDDEFILDQEGKATKIENINLEKIYNRTDEGAFAARKRKYARHQNLEEKQRNRKEIQIVANDGRNMSGTEAINKAKKMEETLKLILYGMVANDITASGQEIDPEFMEAIERQIQKEDLTVNLEKAA
jgi:hypothetical protein